MGIDINCLGCDFTGRQCFCYRRELLDALRTYLKDNKEKHELELKYLNWFYRNEKDDEDKVTQISETEKTDAIKKLRENKLDGLFCWTFLSQEDYISHEEARDFLTTYHIIEKYMKDDCIDLLILEHAAEEKHNLESW
jgi:hypothetical protein